jgi:hypothetical protein
LLLVAVLLATVAFVFMSGPEVDLELSTEPIAEQAVLEIKGAELDEVVLPLPGKGPLQVNLEYIGDANYQSPAYDGSLKGKVLDAYGKPLSFARIEVVGGPQDKKFSIADSSGEYQMHGLLLGMHIFRINSRVSAEIVRMQQISRNTKRDWLIGQTLSVKFEIRDHKNKVLSGAIVQSDFGLRQATTNEKGIALLHGVPSGARVVVDVLAEGHVATRHELNLYAANTTEIIKLSALEKGGRLSGRVKSWPGGDVPTVTIVPRTGESRSGMTTWEIFQDVRVDGNGYFSFDNLPTNQLLDIRISHAQGVCDPRGRAVTAGKEAPTRADFVVRTSKSKVSGNVTDENGVPVAGAEIELLAAEPMKVLGAIYPSIGSQRLAARLPQPSQLRRTARTNKRGEFSIALGDHIQGTGNLLLNVSKENMVNTQRVIKKIGSQLNIKLVQQKGGAALVLARRLDSELPPCEWQTLPLSAQAHGSTAENLLEGYYRIHVQREGKTILREDKYWISGETKIVL